MKQLAQALLDEYPNQEVVIFFNPYFVDGLIQIGTFTDADTLANAIFEMKQELAITEVLDINWFDVFLKNEPETLDTDWIDAVTEDDTIYLLTIMTVNGPVTAAGTLGDFSKHLGQSFDHPEDLEKAVAESTDYLNAFYIDDWSVGQVTVKAIDKLPDEVSFIL
jgi:hypothetical protein